jgi:hypothetical protein
MLEYRCASLYWKAVLYLCVNEVALVCGNMIVSVLEEAVGPVCRNAKVLEHDNAVSQYVTMQTYQHVRMQMRQSILESSFVLMCE